MAAQESALMVAKKAPNPIDKHVGSRVRMRRMMLAMSQEKLRGRARPYLSAGAEIREGHEPDRREPAAADCAHSPRSRRVFL